MNHLFNTGKILPAVTIENSEKAVQVARAIYEGGVSTMEITFRTKDAAASIEATRKNMPDMYIGAGTILSREHLHQARESGALFGLSPGFNRSVVEEAIKLNFPFIPGVMTPSDIESALELEYSLLKLFPAVLLGGIEYLNAMLGPYGHMDILFIPMGGINIHNMASYISLKNVHSVGSSWLATEKLIEKSDYETIKLNTAKAVSIIK